MFWTCGQHEFDTRMPIIMGILNVSPDSFSGDGTAAPAEAVKRALAMIDDGAQIIDVGGESTRPGAEATATEDELAHVLPVVRALAEDGVCVSVDTRHADVARACVDAGASIINDVTGFSDSAMRAVAKACDAGLVVVHSGEHFAGARMLDCDDVVNEVYAWLECRTRELEEAGIARNRICVDFGPGFGKSVRQTIELVYNFHEFRHLGYPVMAALSRKSFIGEMYHVDNPAERDDASAEQALMACELGAGVVRTHNVALTAKALRDLRPYCIIGLGCNVPLVCEPGEEREAKIAQLNLAVGDLCMLPDTQLIDMSSFYESEPAYLSDQDPFVNAVALLRTGIAPKELLDYLHAIENSLGRVREVENGPRTLDLDIEDYQTYVVETDILTLPHARIVERDFVVKPLCEILPGHVLASGVRVDAVSESERVGRAVRI